MHGRREIAMAYNDDRRGIVFRSTGGVVNVELFSYRVSPRLRCPDLRREVIHHGHNTFP